MTITEKQRLKDLIRRAEERKKNEDNKVRTAFNAEREVQDLKRRVR